MNMILYNHSQAKRLNWARERMVAMKDMTGKELYLVLKMIIQILKDNNVSDEVIKKIEDLLD